MAQVTICDRCGRTIGVDPGFSLSIPDDLTRGAKGDYDLCGVCADELAVWLRQPAVVR